jgi:hypothetical protein
MTTSRIEAYRESALFTYAQYAERAVESSGAFDPMSA